MSNNQLQDTKITTVEQLNNIFMKVSNKQSKTGNDKPVRQVKFYDKTGAELHDILTDFCAVEVKGITMPFIDKTRGDKKHDYGANVPEISFSCRNGMPEFTLMERYLKKFHDADLAYSYGLDTGKLIRSIEMKPFNGKTDVFTPLIHYHDGSTLDVKKGDLKEIPGNQHIYLKTSDESDNVFYVKDPPKLMRNYGKDGSIFPIVELDCPGSFNMRRKNEIESTSDQKDISKWGVQIFETKLIDGVWKRRNENIASMVPIITSPAEQKRFVGCVSLYPSYISVMPGGKSKLHFGGSVFFVSHIDSSKTAMAMPVGEFQSSFPVEEKKLSKALTASASPIRNDPARSTHMNDDEEEDTGDFGEEP
jgi:hypothetical protein